MGVAVSALVLVILAAVLLVGVIVVIAVAASGSKTSTTAAVGDASYFDGTTWQLIGYRILAALLCVVTLGIAYPWTLCMLQKWETKHTVIHGRRLTFNGQGHQLIGRWLLWVFLTVVTCGIYGIWLGLGVKKWVVKHTVYADEDTPVDSYFSGGAGGYLGIHILAFLLTAVTFGIGKAWADKKVLEWEAYHTHIGGSPLVFGGTGGQLFVEYLLLSFLSPLTLGIYALFFPVIFLKWQVRNTDAVYQTSAVQKKARAHTQAAVQDFARFRIAANDQELAAMKSGYTGGEDAETLTNMAAAGNPFAAYALALREKGDASHFEGHALELLRTAAAGKYHPALFDLAGQLPSAEALPMLAEAAQHGNAEATWSLAAEYRKQDRLAEAAYWFRVALEWGHPQAVSRADEYEKMVTSMARQLSEQGRTPQKGSAVGVVLGVTAGVLVLLLMAFVVAATLGLRVAKFDGGSGMTSIPEEQYAYDIGQVRTDVTAEDFETFYDMLKETPTLWDKAESFVSETADVETLVSRFLFQGRSPSGLFDSFFEFDSEYVTYPYAESYFGSEPMQICRYDADDVDWALKAVFDRTPIRFERSEGGSCYYEDGYFYRTANELYTGAGVTYVRDFDAVYESIGNDTYRVTVDIVTQWQYNDEPPYEYTWEFEVVPMHSRDQGDYWRILSFTQK